MHAPTLALLALLLVIPGLPGCRKPGKKRTADDQAQDVSRLLKRHQAEATRAVSHLRALAAGARSRPALRTVAPRPALDPDTLLVIQQPELDALGAPARFFPRFAPVNALGLALRALETDASRLFRSTSRRQVERLEAALSLLIRITHVLVISGPTAGTSPADRQALEAAPYPAEARLYALRTRTYLGGFAFTAEAGSGPDPRPDGHPGGLAGRSRLTSALRAALQDAALEPLGLAAPLRLNR